MPAGYRRRFTYDDWANDQTLESLRSSSPQPAMTVRWFGHIVATRWLWLEFLTGQGQDRSVWPEWSLDECSIQQQTAVAAWDEQLRALDSSSLLLDVEYANGQGERFKSRLSDILDHVLAHGAYHRGQIASALRQASMEPPNTDVIHAALNGRLDE